MHCTEHAAGGGQPSDGQVVGLGFGEKDGAIHVLHDDRRLCLPGSFGCSQGDQECQIQMSRDKNEGNNK